MCNCKKKTCRECCPKTVRGPQGPKGDRGPAGPIGPAGSLNGTEITNVIDQSFALGDGTTTVTGATFTPPAGTYLVWFETDWHPTGGAAATTAGNYGIYLNGILQNNLRRIGPQSGGGGGGADSLEHKKMSIHGKITSPGLQAIDVRVTCTSGAGTTITITSGYSLIYIKIS